MLKAFLTTIADVIRKHLGTTETINAQDFVTKIDEVHNEGVVQGKQTEYDRFWDNYQIGMTDHSYAFAGRGWNDETFKPKYNIVPNINTANSMFNNSSITDLELALQRQNVVLDLSNATRLDGCFAYCRALCLPEIVISDIATNVSQMFLSCPNLHTIRKLTFPDKKLTYPNMFNGCINLQNLIIGGVITNSLDFKSSTKLTHDSLMSIIEHLKDYSENTSGTTYKLTLGGDNIDKLTQAEIDIIITKGWDYA